MTDREKAIVMAHTGITMLTGEKFSIFHKYIEDILGRSVWTHELADRSVWEEIKEKSKSDFLELCKNEERPQGDLISRSALKEKLTPIKLYGGVFCKAITEKDIDDAPTVSIDWGIVDGDKTVYARPQGEWIKVKEERMSIDMSGEIVTRYKCSKCGRPITILPSKLADYPFCHCGAEMKGGADMRNPNCVRCDHFGDCEGCEKGEEE